MIYWGAGPPRPAASEGSVSCRLAYASRILLFFNLCVLSVLNRQIVYNISSLP